MGRHRLSPWLSTDLSDLPEPVESVKMCPRCCTLARVVDTRISQAGTVVRRRRCPKCYEVWKTVEFMADDPLIRQEEI